MRTLFANAWTWLKKELVSIYSWPAWWIFALCMATWFFGPWILFVGMLVNRIEFPIVKNDATSS